MNACDWVEAYKGNARWLLTGDGANTTLTPQQKNCFFSHNNTTEVGKTSKVCNTTSGSVGVVTDLLQQQRRCYVLLLGESFWHVFCVVRVPQRERESGWLPLASSALFCSHCSFMTAKTFRHFVLQQSIVHAASLFVRFRANERVQYVLLKCASTLLGKICSLSYNVHNEIAISSLRSAIGVHTLVARLTLATRSCD